MVCQLKRMRFLYFFWKERKRMEKWREEEEEDELFIHSSFGESMDGPKHPKPKYVLLGSELDI